MVTYIYKIKGEDMASAPSGRGYNLFDNYISRIIGEEVKLEERGGEELVSKLYGDAGDVEAKVEKIIAKTSLRRGDDIGVVESRRYPGYRIIFNRGNIEGIITALAEGTLSPRDIKMELLGRHLSSFLERDIELEESRGFWVSELYNNEDEAKADMGTLISKENRFSSEPPGGNIGVAGSSRSPGQFRIVIVPLNENVISIIKELERR
jgi:hypothetical protein